MSAETKIDIIIQKLDLMDSRIDKIDITIAKQELTLEEHVRRTNLLEVAHQNVDLRTKALEVADARWSMALKIFLALLAGAAAIFGVKIGIGV